VFKGTGTEHIKLLLDTSSTGGHRASVALESNSNEVNIATTGSDEMRFSTANTSDALFIKSDGNVGIGTASPVYKFHINQPGNSPQLRISGNANWDFYSYNDNNFYLNNSAGTVLGLLANKDAYFGKNLSIGDSVLSTYHTSYPAVDIGSSASVQGYTGNNGVWLQSNLFYNTNGQWTSKSNDYSAMLELYDGNFNFYNTASGTGTRPLLTPMTIRQNGNVGIGATSPENSLHIKNNTATNGQMIIQGDANNTYIRMNKSGSTWAIGIDASDSNKFKIGNNSDLSAGTRLTVTGSGQVLINTVDPQDDPSMLRVINSMSNLGGICLGKVHNSTNNNNAAVLVHKLGQGQGCQFSGKFIVNSWTGNRHIDCHITSYYTNDSISVNVNSVNSGGIAAVTVRLCTVNVAGSNYLAFVKDGGGSGVSFLNAFIEGNIHFSGGIRELLTAGQNYTVTTTHHTF
jgi:hypothetical protein